METKLVVNCATGEVIEVELTTEEIAQRKTDSQTWATEQAKIEAEKQAKIEAKNVVLKKLGLTADEVTALLN